MNTGPCPKCNSDKRERGKIFPKGNLWDIRFLSEEASSISFRKKVVALACTSCGYIELFLADTEDTQQQDQ